MQTAFLQAGQTAALFSVLGLSAPHSHLSVVSGSDDIESCLDVLNFLFVPREPAMASDVVVTLPDPLAVVEVEGAA